MSNLELITKIKPPPITYLCCGCWYNSESPETNKYFRAFWHSNINKNFDADICLTIWFVCKNNNCVHVFTHYYNKYGRLLGKTEHKGLGIIQKLSSYWLSDTKIKVKKDKIYPLSKRYLWKYGKSSDGITQNVYTFDNVMVAKNNSPLKKSNVGEIDASLYK